MAYTPEERKEMYATVVEKCAEAAVALRGFVDAEPELDRKYATERGSPVRAGNRKYAHECCREREGQGKTGGG